MFLHAAASVFAGLPRVSVRAWTSSGDTGAAQAGWLVLPTMRFRVEPPAPLRGVPNALHLPTSCTSGDQQTISRTEMENR